MRKLLQNPWFVIFLLLLLVIGLSTVDAQSREHRDVNGDGKVNCVDYTVLFYDGLVREFGVTWGHIMYGFANANKTSPTSDPLDAAHLWVEFKQTVIAPDSDVGMRFVKYVNAYGYKAEYWPLGSEVEIRVKGYGYGIKRPYQYYTVDLTEHIDRIRRGNFYWRNVYNGGWY